MAFNEKLGERISKALQKHGVEEVRMFGGVAFMLGGHMCCGVIKDNLMIRVGLDRYEQLVAKAHARPMDFARRPMKGFIYVDEKGYAGAGLNAWLKEAVDFAKSLPPKKRGSKAKAKKRPAVRKAAPRKKTGG